MESGQGIEELHQAILRTLSEIPPKKDFEIFREPVDRVFSMKGFGTVITGTVLSGALKTGEQVEIQPGGLTARVRTLQSHDREVQQVNIGYRAAVNLAGIELNQIRRGDVLVQQNIFKPVQILNARLALLKSSPKPLKNNQRIRLHIHTAEVLARVIVIEAGEIKPGTDGYIQFRLEQPIHAAYQDRFIIRQYSPQLTIGGGIILQTNPPRIRKKYREKIVQNLKMLEGDDYRSKILAGFDDVSNQPHTRMEIKISTNIPMKELKSLLDMLISQKEIFTHRMGNDVLYFSIDQVNAVLRRIEKELTTYHETYPNRPGPAEAELSGKLENVFPAGLLQIAVEQGIHRKKLTRDNQSIRLTEFQPEFSAKESKLYQEIAEHYRKAKFTPPTIKEALKLFDISPKEFKEITSLLRTEGELVYLDETLFIHRDTLVEIEDKVKTFFQKKNAITVPEFKELTGTTRKHAIPLLIYLDNKGITERDGDVRRRGRAFDDFVT
ncbi:MAG: SelB C-terminal domain-containing protein [Calditrichia bacterium]